MNAFAVDLADDDAVEHGQADIVSDHIEATRRVGDLWAASLRSGALVVPSVLVPALLHPGTILTTERNVLLNPRHASAAGWRAVETSFRLDPRLRRRPA